MCTQVYPSYKQEGWHVYNHLTNLMLLLAFDTAWRCSQCLPNVQKKATLRVQANPNRWQRRFLAVQSQAHTTVRSHSFLESLPRICSNSATSDVLRNTWVNLQPPGGCDNKYQACHLPNTLFCNWKLSPRDPSLQTCTFPFSLFLQGWHRLDNWSYNWSLSSQQLAHNSRGLQLATLHYIVSLQIGLQFVSL